MSEPLRAVLIDLEGVMLPMAFMTETLIPLSARRLGAISSSTPRTKRWRSRSKRPGASWAAIDFDPTQAESLLLRWMKQDRKATPLKILQGLVWRESYEAGSLSCALYPDVALPRNPGPPPAFGCSFIPPIRNWRRSCC